MLESVAHQHQQVQKIEAALLLFFGLISAQIAAQPASQTHRQIMQHSGLGLEMEGLYLCEQRACFVERSGRLPIRLSPFSRLYRQAV